MTWPKHLSVDKRIVILLSAQTYESFPRALREVVSNAFDADATRVEIGIDRRAKTITVHDNGTGMSSAEFDLFLRIAGRQRTRPRTTLLGRKRIGQFGIGFLAAFPFCETLQVESTVEGSSVVFRAWIPAHEFRADTGPQQDVTQTSVSGEEFIDEGQRLQHYTRLTLVGTTEILDKYLALPPKTDSQRSFSIRSWDPMTRLRWELSDILPVKPRIKSLLTKYVYPEPATFSVIVNGHSLFANDYVEEVLAHSDSDGQQVGRTRFRYAIGTSWKAIHPDEARGLRVRLNHVGVGPRTYFDLNIAGRTFSRLHWLTGDVDIIEGLDESIALDRDNFTSTEDYDAIREFFRSKLRDLAFYIEDVDEAKRKITQQTSESPRASTEARQDVVDEQLERLRRRGFTIRREDLPTPPLAPQVPPVTIDTSSRTVTVRPSHPVLEDTIHVAGRQHRVKFDSWDIRSSEFKACRLDDDGAVVFNQQYPLFKGSFQDIFRRLQVILIQARQESKSRDTLFQKIQEMLLREFGT